MNKKYYIGGIICLLAIVLIAGMSFSKETGTIKIGGAFLLSGPTASVGVLQKNAVQLAVDQANAAGGIGGKKIELIMQDTAADPKKALDAYQSLKQEGVRIFIADSSPVAAAIRKAAVDDGNVLMVPGATTPSYFDGSDLTCRIALTAKSIAPAYAALLEKKGMTKVAVLLPDNETGKGLTGEINKAIEAAGGKVIATEFYDASPAAGDYRTNITKLKAIQSDADALIFLNTGNTVDAMIRQIHDLGWTKPLISDYYTIENPNFKDLSLANGIDFVDYQYSRDPEQNSSDVEKAFKDQYVARYGSAPVFLAAGHYDGAEILFKAIAAVGENPQKIADYVSHLQNYQGVTGTFSFNSDCEVDRTPVLRSVQNGKIVDLK